MIENWTGWLGQSLPKNFLKKNIDRDVIEFGICKTLVILGTAL